MIVGRNGQHPIENIIRDLKKYTSKQIVKAVTENEKESRKEWMLNLFMDYASKSGKHNGYMFWQNEYHPIALTNFEMAIQKLDYIHMNPVASGVVFEASSYRYSSASDYESNRSGLLKIDFYINRCRDYKSLMTTRVNISFKKRHG